MLELNREEQTVLLEVLAEQVHAITFEISRTDTREYKQGLVRRSKVLDDLYHKATLYKMSQPSPFRP